MSYLSQLFVLIIISLISIYTIFRIVITESNLIFNRNEIAIHTFIRNNSNWINKTCRNNNWSLETSKAFWTDFIICHVINFDESNYKTSLIKKYPDVLKDMILDKTDLIKEVNNTF